MVRERKEIVAPKVRVRTLANRKAKLDDLMVIDPTHANRKVIANQKANEIRVQMLVVRKRANQMVTLADPMEIVRRKVVVQASAVLQKVIADQKVKAKDVVRCRGSLNCSTPIKTDGLAEMNWIACAKFLPSSTKIRMVS